MELEDFRDREERLQPESSANPGFRAPSDEEPDSGEFVHIAGEYREDGECRLFILALVKRINDNEGWDVGGLGWTNNQFLHL